MQQVSETQEDLSTNEYPSSESVEVKGATGPALSTDRILRYATVLWALGAIGLLGWHIFSYLFFCRHLLRCATSLPESVDRRFLQEYEDSRLKIVCSGFIATPILIGLFHPTVVIPRSTIEHRENTEALPGVLRHETVHYQRRDIFS